MRLVVVGLTLSSSWGNGHATTWRALLRAMAARGHRILFLECDRPWYAETRDLHDPDYCRLVFYREVADLAHHEAAFAAADLVIIGSYVADGVAVARHIRPHAARLAFYDIDTPVTLATLDRGECAYLTPDLVPAYDHYFSFTGGPMLERLSRQYGAREPQTLYCAVDPDLYRPLPREEPPRWDLGYLGTYGADRQPALERLLLEPARRLPGRRFVVAGPQYPPTIAWPANVERIEHLPPTGHPRFYNDCRLTLNVTRADMVAAGYSPSVRLFEAAACGTPIVSDIWPGLETIFTPAQEILLAATPEDVVHAIQLPPAALARLGARARARVLAAHTAAHRARAVEAVLAAGRHPGDMARTRKVGTR